MQRPPSLAPPAHLTLQALTPLSGPSGTPNPTGTDPPNGPFGTPALQALTPGNFVPVQCGGRKRVDRYATVVSLLYDRVI